MAGRSDELVSAKLDQIFRLLQGLFILHAVQMGMRKEELRKVLRVDKNRVGRISRNLRKE